MKNTGITNRIILALYMLVPFLFEIKILLEWLMTTTALDLIRWKKFEYIHMDLFNAKCGNKGYIYRERGKTMTNCAKCCG
jgi:hypothetical protein